MFYVKVSGETLGELVIGLEAKLNEINNRTVKTPRTFSVVNEETEQIEEMEEVDSPYNSTTVLDNEKDTEGLPWDSRIHSGGKSINKDGTWKAKKGVDKALVLQVKAELLNRGGSVAAAPVVYTEPAAPINQAPVTQPSMPSAAPTLPQVVSGHTLQSFQSQFALIMANLITQGKLTQEYVNTLKNHFGTEVYLFTPEQQAACFSEFVNCGIIQQVG